MNGLDLFSGIGGITLALKEYVKPIAYCEIDAYCQSILLQRMQEGNLPKAPIWNDIKTLSDEELPGQVDIIYGGFPCQDISVAGTGKGLEGERSGLFFEIIRLTKEIKPQFIFLENVSAITTRGGLEVIQEVTSLGYDCRWCVISAESIGALHQRKRWFLLAKSNQGETVANTDGVGYRRGEFHLQSNNKKRETCTKGVSRLQSQNGKNSPNNIGAGGQNVVNINREYWPFKSRNDWQTTVSSMGKCTNGVSHRLDRLKTLGNSVVPQQVRKAFMILSGKENDGSLRSL